MPAYSFQERFVPFVKDGSKPHTIRARRKRQSIKKGDTVYLYYGMRTKHCVKLREEICIDVKTIVINNRGIFLFDERLSDEEYNILSSSPSKLRSISDADALKLFNSPSSAPSRQMK